MLQKPLESLNSRTFIGLLLAQFTATFNDQMVHMVALFYASDILVNYVGTGFDKKKVIALVTACFLVPFVLFSPYAGQLADRFSKRSIVVFWKLAEVIFMLLALIGFSLIHFSDALGIPQQSLAVWSAGIVVTCVFLMGMHSTFFVPAKYGIMPEILHPHILSRGNGFLEGSSFSAQIFGTALGGVLYLLCKSEIREGVLIPGHEWVIGVVLVVLSSIGTITAVLMEKVPPAAPHVPFSWSWWPPMRVNLRILWSSRPLILAVTGIAFAAFMTIFLRQTLVYEGEKSKEYHDARIARRKNFGPEHRPAGEQPAPPKLKDSPDGHRPPSHEDPAARNPMIQALTWLFPKGMANREELSELRVSLMIALVGLGVGVGSLLAGYLSGHRVELGLVPIGGGIMATLIFIPAFMLDSPSWMIASFLLIGAAAGLYIVPLYSLMQQRAPKKSKGNVVAASNFLNVTAGLLAVIMFYGLTFVLEAIYGTRTKLPEVAGDHDLLSTFISQLKHQMLVPRLLFAGLGCFTLLALVMLVRRMPDFLVRSSLWLGAWRRPQLRVDGLEHLPVDGPVILAGNWDHLNEALLVAAATDRYTRLIVQEDGDANIGGITKRLSYWSGLVLLPENATVEHWNLASESAMTTLKQGELVGISVTEPSAEDSETRVIEAWRAETGARVVPVFCIASGSKHTPGAHVVFGEVMPPDASLNDTRTALKVLAETTG